MLFSQITLLPVWRVRSRATNSRIFRKDHMSTAGINSVYRRKLASYSGSSTSYLLLVPRLVVTHPPPEQYQPIATPPPPLPWVDRQ